MNAADRIALTLGRALIRAENLQEQLDEAHRVILVLSTPATPDAPPVEDVERSAE